MKTTLLIAGLALLGGCAGMQRLQLQTLSLT